VNVCMGCVCECVYVCVSEGTCRWRLPVRIEANALPMSIEFRPVTRQETPEAGPLWSVIVIVSPRCTARTCRLWYGVGVPRRKKRPAHALSRFVRFMCVRVCVRDVLESFVLGFKMCVCGLEVQASVAVRLKPKKPTRLCSCDMIIICTIFFGNDHVSFPTALR